FGETILNRMIHNREWVLFFIMPVCFVAAWWIVKKWAPYARGSGIPQVMAAVELANPRDYNKVKKLLSLRIIFFKVVSSFIMVLGGGAIGREGPTIQISGSVFKKLNEILPKWWPQISKKSMILTGAAAGLSAAFNTPLGGIVFAVEELTKIHFNNFKTAIFTAVIIAGLTSQQLAGSYLYLGFPKVAAVAPDVLFAVVVVAILSGLAASWLAKLILTIQRWRNSFTLQWQHLLFLITSALILASVAYFINTNVLGSGKELMEDYLFTLRQAHWYTPFLRMIGPALSFASGGAGGIFAPALSGGASIGSVFAAWFHLSPTEGNVVILVGMVGFLTGITRAPFTSAILVLEMTDRHSLILHLMMAAVIANFAASLISQHSFYDHLKHDYLRELEKKL
ncbi:MAG: chloride channel protein, partial [Niabella sp.]